MIFFISILIGAVIGYITNWLAIKMLFRPRTEKRIGEFKVPFTPGLIPKEKSRIAKSVGETVGTHLITGENMMEAMESQEMKGYFREIFNKKVEEAKNSNKTVENLGKDFLGEKYDEFTYSMEQKSSTYLIDKISNEDTVKKISEELFTLLKKVLNENPNKILQNMPINNILNKMLKSEGLKEDLRIFLGESLNKLENNEKTLKEVVPQGVFQGIEVYAFNQRDEIAFYIRKLLRKEEVTVRIKDIIEKNVLSNMNPLVSMFMNAESLYSKFTTMVDDYLQNEENKQEIARIIINIVKSFGDKEIKYILEGIPSQSKNDIVKDVNEKIVGLLNGEVISNKILNLINDKLNKFGTIHELIRFFNPEYEEGLYLALTKIIKNMIYSDFVKEKVKNIVEELVVSMEKKHINEILPEGNTEGLESLFNKLQAMVGKLLKDNGDNLMERLDIANIVEKQINSFPVEYAEELIIGIANKELKAITWLGALLGGFMGLLTPILSKLLG